jgi:hypothetical protein
MSLFFHRYSSCFSPRWWIGIQVKVVTRQWSQKKLLSLAWMKEYPVYSSDKHSISIVFGVYWWKHLWIHDDTDKILVDRYHHQ